MTGLSMPCQRNRARRTNAVGENVSVAERWLQLMMTRAREELAAQEAYDRAAYAYFNSQYDVPETINEPLTVERRIRGWRWEEIRRRIFARDSYTCTYCGQVGGRLECDHIRAVSKGGSNEDVNLTTACFTCNRRKRTKDVARFRAEVALG